MSTPRVLVALDYRNAVSAFSLVDQLDPALCGLKVGKELFTAEGPALVRQLVKRGFAVFLDLKFHDIPNTVAGAVAAAADLGVWMVNVHASGGSAMMQAARQSLESYGAQRPLLTAVTVLTSLTDENLREVGITCALTEQVRGLAQLTKKCGLDGVVCSAQEASLLREECGKDFLLVTPGIRMAADARGDQQRIVTPREAVQMGSSYLVIGRPITQALDPLKALRTIIEDISYKN